jgi:SNF2 family DNA or RNA helicase
MGLGKSLQALGLILVNPPKNPSKPQTTLIVCPVSVMSNWTLQVEQHLQPNTLKIGLYHGPDRSRLLSTLSDLDILITSYGTISTEYSNYSNRKISDDANFAIDNQSRTSKKRQARHESSIFEQSFHRIILDEGHHLRNTQSKTYVGCMALRAANRLAITGTPILNKPDDIHSLLSFLSVDPLSDKSVFRRYIAQPIYIGDPIGLSRLRAVMAHIALRRNKSKLNLVSKTVELRSVTFPDDCAHKKIHDALFDSARMVFRATLSSGSDSNISKNYMKILETLMRIRQACLSGELVPKASIDAAEAVLKYVGEKQELSAEDGERLLEKLKGAFDDTTTTECAICFDTMEENDAVILRKCSHVFCELCLSKVSEKYSGVCPMCRCPFEASDMIKSCVVVAATLKCKKDPNAEPTDTLGPSPKLKALALAISEMKDDEKGVIFSQFTKFLDVLETFLEEAGHALVRIDGSKTPKQRIHAMKEFNQETGGPRFIICSLHAAGTGISLTRGNHCFMMDTWWNSSVEQQAMDRVSCH